MSTVSVLYVDPRGPYASMARGARFMPLGPQGQDYCWAWDRVVKAAAVDAWDESRDARKYDGPNTIVAHPPCKHWGQLRHMAHVECTACYVDAGGAPCGCGWRGRACELLEGVRCPDCKTSQIDWSDRDCAPRAVEQVRRWGGVLEHPAGSLLFGSGAGDLGVKGDVVPLPGQKKDTSGGYTIKVDQVEWGHVARKPTWLYLVGVPRSALEAPPFPGREPTHAVAWRSKAARAAGRRECSAEKRRRTPPLFAEYLIRLASAANR